MKANYNTQKVFEALQNASENTNDWFSIDAASLIKEAEVNRRTFFRIMNKLESNGIIERQRIGKRSQIRILKELNFNHYKTKAIEKVSSIGIDIEKGKIVLDVSNLSKNQIYTLIIKTK